MSTARWVSVIALTVALLCAAACENSEPSAEEHDAVEDAVRGYLNALAEAYSTLDTRVLDEWASPNEIAAVRKLLTQLAQTGDRIDSKLIGFEIESMAMFRGVNATVRLIEVWDVTRYGALDGREKGRSPSSLQNTLLQLRRVDGRWVVVGRTIMSRETPVTEEQQPATGDGG